jgi:hypothetical protein
MVPLLLIMGDPAAMAQPVQVFVEDVKVELNGWAAPDAKALGQALAADLQTAIAPNTAFAPMTFENLEAQLRKEKRAEQLACSKADAACIQKILDNYGCEERLFGTVRQVRDQAQVTLTRFRNQQMVPGGTASDYVKPEAGEISRMARALALRLYPFATTRMGGGTVSAGQAFDRGDAIVNQLTDDTGYLTIESEPPGATLSLNGKEVGKAPKQLEQMAGRWVVTAEMGKLYHPAREEVQVTAGSNQKVSLKLEPAFGTLKVSSEPAGAEVWVDGEKVGSTPYLNAQKPSGTYDVRVERENYLSWNEQVTVQDGRETAKTARLEQNFGGLAVSSEPLGAAIELNGRATREATPHTFEVLEPGLYTVKLTREGYGDALERASVQNRQTARLNIPMQARLGLLSLMSTNPDGTPCEGRVYLDGEQKGTTPLKLQVTATSHEVRVVCNGAERKETVAVGHDEKKKLEWVVGNQRADVGARFIAPGAAGGRSTAGGSGAMRDNGDGTVTDPSTGLVWEKKPSTRDLNWEKAKSHCQAKGRGWRLPTISELRSLIRGCPGTVSGGACKVTDACLSGSCWSSDDCWACNYGGGPAGGCYRDATLEGSCGWFWVSSPVADYSGDAWSVGFGGGRVYNRDVGDGGRGVRCVR